MILDSLVQKQALLKVQLVTKPGQPSVSLMTHILASLQQVCSKLFEVVIFSEILIFMDFLTGNKNRGKVGLPSDSVHLARIMSYSSESVPVEF